MAQRSRKRARSAGAGEAAGGLADTPELGGAPQPRTRRQRRDAAAPEAPADGASTSPPADRASAAAPADGAPTAPAGDGASPGSADADAAPNRPSRTERRNAEARAALEPLAEGERPGAVTAGAIVAVVLGALVLIGYASGARVGGQGSLAGALFLAAIFFVAAWGMWNLRYWAVLGFEALLAFQLVIASLSLAVASNWWAALLCVLVIGFGGWLFWKLIRAMARIQMPERRPAP